MAGNVGRFLRVDMTKEEVWDETFDEATMRSRLGGTGIGAMVLYNEVPPGVEWNDPENRITIASGPLGGSPIPGSGTYSVVTKGPLTNGATATQGNGFWGAYLRFAGYDGVIVQGAASRLLYLHIGDHGAVLKDASHLAGKDTWETDDLIKEELGKREKGMSIVCIGPAGENLVKLAAICSDKGHVAGHNGPGAVMGSKKLKAIAVDRVRGRPKFEDSRKMREIGKVFNDRLKTDPSLTGFFNYGTLGGLSTGVASNTLPTRNYTTNVFNLTPAQLEAFTPAAIRANFAPIPDPCWACQTHHCHKVTVQEGPYKGEVAEEQEYEGYAAWASNTGQPDVNAAMVISNDVDRWGMDTNEMGYLMGMAMECYEAGIINREDTDGLELNFGNADATRAMLKKIAFREGFGNVLAEGVMRAAKLIGGDAPNRAVHTMKGNSVRGHDHRLAWLEMFDTSVSSTGTIESHRGTPRAMFGIPEEIDLFSPEAVVDFTVKAKPAMQFEDALGVCRFCTRMDFPLEVEALMASTGWEGFTFEEAKAAGLRTVNTLKAFNIRHGIGPELDKPSPRYGSPAEMDGPGKGISIEPHWDGMVRSYYEQMGWDPETSKPLPETLEELGLAQVSKDLWS